MTAFIIAFWKEWTTAIRERRELASAFAYALAGPLLIAVLITHTAREAADTTPAPWRYCEGSAVSPPLTTALEAKGMMQSAEAEACLELPQSFEADLAAGRASAVAIVADLNAADKPARKLKSALDAYAKALGQQRLAAAGVGPEIATPLTIELRNTSPIGVMADRLIGALILFLICAPFFICQSTAIDATAGERERRGLEPMLILPMPRTALILAKFAITFVIGLTGAFATIALSLLIMRKTPLAELGVTLSLDLKTALIATAMLIPLTAAVAALQMAIGLWSRTFKEGQTYALLFAFTPVALGFGALVGGSGGIKPWPVMFEIAALKAPLLGAPLPDITAWTISAALTFGIAALALASCVWRLRDEKLLAES
jgi:sodium transport system permease protein